MYTNREYGNMLMIYGECGGNSLEASRRYAIRYPNSRHPSPNVFRRLEDRIFQFGVAQPLRVDNGRPRTAMNPDMEENIIELLENNPCRSSRSIANELNISQSSVSRLIRQEQFHPYHYTKVQALLDADFPRRLNFAQWYVQTLAFNPEFGRFIMWTDEASFTRDGFFNVHNNHYYALENPHVVHERSHQQRFGVNVWAAIIGTRVLGPIFLPLRLNGRNFLHFLHNEFQDVIDDLPLNIVMHMWLQMDGAPAHFDRQVTGWLNDNYPERWIGRSGPILWAPRSADMTPLDFFLWGHIKSLVYRTPVEDEVNLVNRILDAFRTITPAMLERVQTNILRRAHLCIEVNGQHFEQLL